MASNEVMSGGPDFFFCDFVAKPNGGFFRLFAVVGDFVAQPVLEELE
jgi:hypothetical protein